MFTSFLMGQVYANARRSSVCQRAQAYGKWRAAAYACQRTDGLRPRPDHFLFLNPYQGFTMNTKLMSACFVAATLLTPFAARAADSDADRAHPGAFVKDSVITTKVKTKLAAEKMRTLTHIRVDTDRNGIVVLSGSAKTKEDADKAASIARETEGVTLVQNNIKIKKDE
jgi:hyperosmotically inducible protein